MAAEVARALDAPLELVVARKLGAPQQPEFAVGAIAPLGVRVVDRVSMQVLGIPEEELDRAAALEFAEMKRRIQLYGGEGNLSRLMGLDVILVDDGVATGLTVQAAVRSIKKAGARRVLVAVPVCSLDAKQMLEGEADEVIALAYPEPFGGVGVWYDDFSQVSDDQVLRLLGRSPETPAGEASA